jgi:glycosyltransferase involved in cell wall biosynthesis
MITYNHAPFVRQAVESVLMQKVNFAYELVIGEDCSTDRTREIVLELQRRYPDRIRLLLSEKNLGENANLIRTLCACRGQYVAFLDGDDYWTSRNKLQKQADFLDAHPDHSSCFHAVRQFLDTKEEGPCLSPRGRKSSFGFSDIVDSNFMPTSSVMLRNGLIREFPPLFKRVKMSDWPTLILTAQYGKIGFINEVMSVDRLHRGGVWSPRDPTWKIQQSIALLEEINAYLEFRHDDIIKRSISVWHYRLALLWAREGNVVRARNYARICTHESWRYGKLPPTLLMTMWLAVSLPRPWNLILSAKPVRIVAQRLSIF